MKRAESIGCIVIVAIAVASCGSSRTVTQTASAAPQTAPSSAPATHTTSPATVTRQQAAQAYEAAVAPANAAGDAFSAKTRGYTDSTTGAQVTADAQPFVQQLTKLNAKLSALANMYPPAAADLKALINAYNPVIGDLQSASAQNAFSTSSWVEQLATDLSKTQGAVAIVHADLGLPPVNS